MSTERTKKRISVLIGAGGVVDIGAPTTQALTKKMETKLSGLDLSNAQQLLTTIQKLFQCYFSSSASDELNFEDLIHIFERMIPFVEKKEQKTYKGSSPHISAFVDLNPEMKNVASIKLLHNMISEGINEIANCIDQYSRELDFKSPQKHQWFAAFWKDLLKMGLVDIISLNYDNVFEKIFVDLPLIDGFSSKKGDSVESFSPKVFSGTSKSRLFHLHGSILFGYNDPENLLLNKFHHLVKFTNYDSAQETWQGRSGSYTQGGDFLSRSPIITGLSKTDRIFLQPYLTYLSEFVRALAKSPRLLIVGYGFNDLYINELLEIVPFYHKNRKIVIIDYFPENKHWCPDPTVMDWPEDNKLRYMAIAMKERDLFDRWGFSGLGKNTFFESDDKRCRLYLKGTKDALGGNGDDIIKFLVS